MKLKEVINESAWSLYLDDIRMPKYPGFTIARNVDEAKRLIKKKGFPSYMSLDHDLGEGEPTGHDFVKWIVNEYMDKDLPEFEFVVHSANPVGKENMETLLNNFIRHKRNK